MGKVQHEESTTLIERSTRKVNIGNSETGKECNTEKVHYEKSAT